MKSVSYEIPNEFHAELKNINTDIDGIAKKLRTTKTEIVNLLTEWALERARDGSLLFTKRTRYLQIVEKDQVVVSIEIGPKKMKNSPRRIMRYRFLGNQPAAISAIAAQCCVPKGEVLLILFRHALEQYRAEAFSFTPRRQSFVEIKERTHE